jgi:purine-nucleoside phosphorylase
VSKAAPLPARLTYLRQRLGSAGAAAVPSASVAAGSPSASAPGQATPSGGEGVFAEPDDAGEIAPRSRSYDPALADLALEATRRVDAVARKGVYAFLSGPSYETRAEYRMLRRIEADVVGMSTVPEIVAAARMGLDVVACSVVTNVARPDAPEHTDAEDVCRLAADAADGVWAILQELARDAGPPTVAGAAA